jgi:CHAD domain-containing protein
MLDRGKIRAIGRDDAALQVCEIELELKKGSPAAIYDVALQILAATPVQIETRSKSDRGYALQAPGAGAIAVKANAPRADRGDSLATLLRGAARCHFGQFIANLQGALEHDADSIYQMRVAMRRLSAALLGVRDLLPRREYEAVRMKPRDLLRSLGPARDWQVLGERLSELEDEDGTGAPVVRVIGAVAAGRRRALSGASRAMDSAGTARTVLEAMRWFEDLADSRHGRRLAAKAPAAAKGVLDALFARVRRRGRHFPRQSVADRHRLRIACKNLRYNVELFAALFGGHKVEKFIARLKPVQDDLGQLNDVNRARELLLGALAGRTPQKAAAAAVIARLEARVAAADRRARKHVAALRDARPFW